MKHNGRAGTVKKFALVSCSGQVEETSVPDQNDEWDRASTHTDWVVGDSFALLLGDTADAVELSFDPQQGKTYYMVYYIWSDGDSFGHDSQSGCEVHGIYATEKEADAVAKALTEDDSYARPWNGYFNSLDLLEVKGVQWDGIIQ